MRTTEIKEASTIEARVGALITVSWSNGAGYSVYRIIDNPDSGPHLFERVADYEATGSGDYKRT